MNACRPMYVCMGSGCIYIQYLKKKIHFISFFYVFVRGNIKVETSETSENNLSQINKAKLLFIFMINGQ